MNALAEGADTMNDPQTDPSGTGADASQDAFLGDASYSPDDNKIRIRAYARLDRPVYDRLRAAGFIWAPKQEIFVAPMWTPERADLAEELCGDIGDEDTSLVERAEERAERFEDYSDRRAGDAAAAHRAVEEIGKRFEFGQPILIGHHSEKSARRDKKRIDNGMRRAVKMWETSKYWTARAKGALRNASYKQRPDVRHRRIKGLDADKRKHETHLAQVEMFLRLWQTPELTLEQARKLAGVDHADVQEEGKTYRTSLWSMLGDGRMTAEQAAAHAIPMHDRMVAWHKRWLAHTDLRLAYERELLEDGGGLTAAKYDLQVGGRILAGREPGWAPILRLNKKDGAVVSVTVACRWGKATVGIESIAGYRAPEPGDAEKVAAATKLPPIVNFRSEGATEMTKAEWDRCVRCQAGAMRKAPATATHGAYRHRTVYRGGTTKAVFVTDMKVVERPAAPKLAAEAEDPSGLAPVLSETAPRAPRVAPQPTVFDAMKATLKSGGVQVVSAPNLFPTPDGLADELVARANLRDGDCVIEPSAGTGSLINAVRRTGVAVEEIVAIEINAQLVSALRSARPKGDGVLCVVQADFLEWTPVGRADRIIMNPPFSTPEDAQADIAHVMRAWEVCLRPGGRLVAIMSAGTRFRDNARARAFRELIAAHGTMEDLPEDSFKESGTSVRTVLVVLDKPEAS